MNGESAISFKELFSKDIDRNINGVIKANDEKNLDDEVNEYVLTEEICRNLAEFLDAYNDPSNHEQNGAWISGFFGSGKSHLLKMLSHILGEVPAELVDKGNMRRAVSMARIHSSRNSNVIWRTTATLTISNKHSNTRLANRGARDATRPCYGMMRSAKPMPR